MNSFKNLKYHYIVNPTTTIVESSSQMYMILEGKSRKGSKHCYSRGSSHKSCKKGVINTNSSAYSRQNSREKPQKYYLSGRDKSCVGSLRKNVYFSRQEEPQSPAFDCIPNRNSSIYTNRDCQTSTRKQLLTFAPKQSDSYKTRPTQFKSANKSKPYQDICKEKFPRRQMQDCAAETSRFRCQQELCAGNCEYNKQLEHENTELRKRNDCLQQEIRILENKEIKQKQGDAINCSQTRSNTSQSSWKHQKSSIPTDIQSQLLITDKRIGEIYQLDHNLKSTITAQPSEDYLLGDQVADYLFSA